VKFAIVYFNKAAEKIAKKIAKKMEGEIYFSPSKETMQKLFKQGTAIIGICASGILIRFLATFLNDKQNEPPVIAVSNDGAHVVPLLGGHHGANDLAQEIADLFAGQAAITTASNAQFSCALDEPPMGYVMADVALAKKAMVAVLNGEGILLDGKADWFKNAGYEVLENASELVDRKGVVKIAISEKTSDKNTLTYHPKTLIIGVGCERYLPANELIELVEKVIKENKFAPHSIAAIASIDVKADEKAVNELAAYYGVPLRLFSAAKLANENTPNPSEIVRQEVGTPSVAEACAIKAGELIVEKQKSKRATCAIGRAVKPIDVEKFGMARGQLHIVGIGPGEEEQRTISVIKALKNSSDWVGYGFYLDLVANLKLEQIEHRFPLGDEEKRVRHALELAASGKNVSLICSGDGQIYAMAALVFELLDARGKRALSENAKRVEVVSHSGISALQMASSRVGAILGHDFCAISLSDLLTPKEAIISRLEAAAMGDFVTAFYNPRSKTRTDLLDKAKEIFLKFRSPNTPIIIARSLGRKDEKVRIITLGEFDTSEVDMMCIVLFGSSNSKSFKRGDGKQVVFTPRGYDKKVSQ